MPADDRGGALSSSATERRGGRCNMRGQCGKSSIFSPDLPCALDEAHADEPSDALRKAAVATCGQEYADGPLCCTADQVENLAANLDQAEPLVSACPACRNNFRGLFCAMTCGGDQSRYLDVVQTQKTSGGVDGDVAVKEVNYWVGNEWRDAFYESCRDVKFGPGNSFAMDLLGGGAKNADQLLKYLGDVRPLIGSPFQINFPRTPSEHDAKEEQVVWTSNTTASPPPQPFNPPPRHCDDAALLSRCACTDCPAVCAALPPVEVARRGDICSLPLPGGIRVPCFSILIVILYFASLAVALVGQNKRARRISIRHRNSGISVHSEASGYERVRLGSDDAEGGSQDQRLVGASGTESNDDGSTGRGRGLFSTFLASRRSGGATGGASPAAAGAWALSASQPRSYLPSVMLSRFFYRLGRFCAGSPYITFSIAFVLLGLANIGWTRFEVETDPIRLWVSPDSEARHRKAYFDEHFGPFYRTQQAFIMDESAAPLAGTRTTMSDADWNDALLTTSAALNWQRLEWWADVEAAVRELKTANGTTLQDVCFAPSGKGGPCVVQSIMGYFGDDLAGSGVTKDTWQASLDRCASTPAECLPSFGQPLKRNIILGGLPQDTPPSQSRSAVTTWVLANSLDKDVIKRAQEWEIALEELLFAIAGVGDAPLHPLGERRRALGLVMSINTESSLEQELARAGNTDVIIVVLSYMVMFLYASLTLGGGADGGNDVSAAAAAAAAANSGSDDAFSRPHGTPVRSGLAGRLFALLPSFRAGRYQERNRRWARRFLVQSKFSLGLFGIMVVLASVSAAVGVWSALGVKVTLVIVEVLPFLLLAVGVDNIFLLADEMDRQNALTSRSNPYARDRQSTGSIPDNELGATIDGSGELDDDDDDDDGNAAAAAAAYGSGPSRRSGSSGHQYTVPASERAARTLSRVGPSIVLSASVQVCAFLLGATIPMPAVRHFALYAAASMAFAAVLQCTVFVAAMAWDADRVEADRIDCLPCVRLPIASASAAAYGTAVASDYQLGTSHGLKGEGRLGRMIRRSYAPTLIKPRVKTVVLAAFGATFALSCMLVPGLKMGLDQRLALPKGSYLRDYYDAVDSFLDVGPPVYYVARDVDVTTRAGQQAICGRFTTCQPYSLANTLEGERARRDVSYVAEPASSWLDDFFQWLNPMLDTCCRVKKADPTVFCSASDSSFDCQPCFEARSPAWNITLEGMPEGDEFMHYLRQWLVSPTDADCPLGGQAAYSAALSITDDKVVASHLRTFHTPLRSQADFIDALRATERISANVKQATDEGVDVYAYAVYVPFFDQYLYLDRLAAQLLGGALLAIVGVTTALLGSFRTALIVAACVSNAVFCVAAVMAVLGIGLNALTLVNLGVCAAICVEFCAHVARAFMRAPGSLPRHHALAQRERDDRTWAALVDVGPSVISGITGTKLVGISVLFWAQSDILKLYYASLWFALIIIGAVHGLVFLPVLLSIFGGRGYASGDDEAEVSRRLRRAHDSAEFRPFAADAEAEDSEDEYY